MTRSTLEGVAALTKQLQALGQLENGNALRRAVRAGIRPALVKAREIVPVGTQPHRLANGLLVNSGFAKDSLRTIATINGARNIASGILGVRKDAFYVLQYVELGTRYQPAQPFLRRALLEAQNDCEEGFRASLQKSVLKAADTK